MAGGAILCEVSGIEEMIVDFGTWKMRALDWLVSSWGAGKRNWVVSCGVSLERQGKGAGELPQRYVVTTQYFRLHCWCTPRSLEGAIHSISPLLRI